jgi:succinate-acetate transporter protein
MNLRDGIIIASFYIGGLVNWFLAIVEITHKDYLAATAYSALGLLCVNLGVGYEKIITLSYIKDIKFYLEEIYRNRQRRLG